MTGSSGQIGRALVSRLRQRYGAQSVVATDLDVTTATTSGLFRLDACDRDQVERFVVEHQATGVVHLAAILSADAEKDPIRALHVNNRGQEAVLEVAKRHNLAVFSPSSIAVHRKRDAGEVVTCPSTVYGISKLYGEYLGQYYAEKFGVDYRSLRIPGVMSRPAENHRGGGGTTDWAVEMFQIPTYSCFLRPDTVLPMVYVADLVEGITKFLKVPRSELTRSVYEVASFSVSPAQLAEKIREFVPNFSCNYDDISEYRQAIADTWPASLDDSAARRDWGWAPEYDLDATVSANLERRRDGGKKDDRLQFSPNPRVPSIDVHRRSNLRPERVLLGRRVEKKDAPEDFYRS